MRRVSDIPYGHRYPMARPSDAVEDRAFRYKIGQANSNGDCIINVGNGYYRPVPGDKVDEMEFEEYMGRELHRARDIQKKRLSMRLAFERRREYGIFNDDSRASM